MIAPWHEPLDDRDMQGRRQPEFLRSQLPLAIVRRMIAAALLPQGDSAPLPAAAWRAWLWAGWMALTIGTWILNLGF
jgi:hypothetical protein